MRKGLFFTAALVVATCFAGRAQAEQKVLLNDTGSARALGMGNAFTGLADDIQSVLWNPAGIAQVTGGQALYGDSFGSDQKSVRFAGFVQPSKDGPSGAVTYLRVDNGAYGIKENSLGYTFAQKWNEKLMLGANVKYSRFRRTDESKETFNVDLGALYNINDTATFGVAVLNAGNPRIFNGNILPEAKAARLVNAGLALKLQPFVKPGQLGTAPADYLTTVTFDLFDATDEVRRQLRFGVEHQFTDNLVGRAGLLSDNPTIGFGARVNKYVLNAGFLIGRSGHRSSESMLSLATGF